MPCIAVLLAVRKRLVTIESVVLTPTPFPNWMRYRVVHYKDVFTFRTQVRNFSHREWIDSPDDLYRVQECMSTRKFTLFICYDRRDMAEIIWMLGK
ncbi:hypothetical protein [Brevibacillus porteri]|uniref:hypothetical protein n=1 Tax=Brevibacillus porteri TaxID=2126350 RepID=UPI003D22669A